MPHWYQSIDWSEQGFERSESSFYRLGQPILIKELVDGHSSDELLKRNKACALIASHLTSPRDLFASELEKIMPVHLIGVNGTGPSQFRSGTPKRDILSEYLFVLAPENSLFPGYITEKIPEAYVCGSYPIGWYAPSLLCDFTNASHFNIALLGSSAFMCEGLLSHSIQEIHSKILRDGVPPLVDKSTIPVTLNPLIEILSRILDDAR